MSCCICRTVEVEKRESQFNKFPLKSTNLRKYFTFPDDLKSEFEIKEVIGEGNNTTVYKAKCNSTDDIVAIKVIVFPTPNEHRHDKQTTYIQSNNLEINILKNIDNINCIHLISYYFNRHKENNIMTDAIFLVTDYFDLSLHLAFSTKKFKFMNNMTMIKIFSFQLFKGLSYLHNTVGIAHCDIKPSNLLFNSQDCILKICDFGTARILARNSNSQDSNNAVNYISYLMIQSRRKNSEQIYSDTNNNNSNDSNYTDESNEDTSVYLNTTTNNNDFVSQPIQTTMPYRAPEILYECQNIDPSAADIWSAGCVIAEILRGNGKKLFSSSKSSNNATTTLSTTKIPGGSSCTPIEQLNEIISILGQPNLNDFDKHEQAAIIVSAKKTKSLDKMLPKNTPKELLSLLKKILVFCPEERPTAEECINSPFFDDIIDRDDIQIPNGRKAPKLFR
ncbi:hypothetical protein M9Y10_013737 [Tritrichomonas musculus]|uniref:Protein kinase domain-containing protein n=1 Tax=Tritrichomonas musculus TaxID=1915356 RepID=A0ABR2KXP2_9EUKA